MRRWSKETNFMLVLGLVGVLAFIVSIMILATDGGAAPPPPKATFNTYEAQSVNYADPGQSATSQVSCPAGQVAISGSADIVGASEGQHQQSIERGHTWSASVDAGTTLVGVKAHVICAKGTEEEHDEAP